MIKFILKVNSLLCDFFDYLQRLNKKEFLVKLIIAGFLSGLILGLMSFGEKILLYGSGLPLLSKIGYFFFSVSLLSLTGIVLAIIEFVFLMVLLYLYTGASGLTRKGEKIYPYKLLLLTTLIFSALTMFLFVRYFIETPSDMLVDLLRMNDLFISLFNILFIVVAIFSVLVLFHFLKILLKRPSLQEKVPVKSLIIKFLLVIIVLLFIYYLYSIASNSWQFNQWISEVFFVSYNTYWVKFLNFYSNNLIFFKVNLFFTLTVVFLIINYLFIFFTYKIYSKRQYITYLSIFYLLLFVISYVFAQNFFANQLFAMLKTTLLLLGFAFISFVLLQTIIILNLDFLAGLKKVEKLKKINNRLRIFILAIYLLIFILSLTAFNNMESLKAFVYRYNTFARIVLHWPVLFCENKTLTQIKPVVQQTIKNQRKTDTLMQDNLKHKPDVFLIVIDALRNDTVQDSIENKTDAISDFADQAYNFKNAYSHTTYTVASISSTMLSKFFMTRSDIDFITLAEVLSANGYQTVVFNNFTKTFNFDFIILGNTKYDTPFSKGFNDVKKNKTWSRDDKTLHDKALTENVISYINDYKLEKPIFAYIHYSEMHSVPSTAVFKNLITAESFSKDYQKAYVSELKKIQTLLTALKKYNRYENSIIIITTDHGEALKDHGDIFHVFSLYQELVNIPLIIKMPGQQEPEIIQMPVSLLDLYPTLLDNIGYDYTNLNIDGQSFLPALKNEHIKPHPVYSAVYLYKDPLVFAYNLYGQDEHYDKSIFEVAMIDENNEWKFIYNIFFGFKELYNLKSDPTERNNLIDSHQQIAEQMLQKIQETLFLKK